MMKWSSKVPKKSGYFWKVEKFYIDGELQSEHGPKIVEVHVEKDWGSIIISSCGSDDCDFINPDRTPIMDTKSREPRDFVFSFDDQETANRKRSDIVTKRFLTLLSPIEMVAMPKEGE